MTRKTVVEIIPGSEIAAGRVAQREQKVVEKQGKRVVNRRSPGGPTLLKKSYVPHADWLHNPRQLTIQVWTPAEDESFE